MGAMIEIPFNSETLILRLAKDSDVSELRSLINSAYKELLEQGLNYTATYQDEEKTRERISTGRAFVLLKKQQIIATINKFVG